MSPHQASTLTVRPGGPSRVPPRCAAATNHCNRVRAAAGLGNAELYLVTRHYFGWYAFDVLCLPDHVIALHLGHRGGGNGIYRLLPGRKRPFTARRSDLARNDRLAAYGSVPTEEVRRCSSRLGNRVAWSLRSPLPPRAPRGEFGYPHPRTPGIRTALSGSPVHPGGRRGLRPKRSEGGTHRGEARRETNRRR
jgi:hypothetical protein